MHRVPVPRVLIEPGRSIVAVRDGAARPIVRRETEEDLLRRYV